MSKIKLGHKQKKLLQKLYEEEILTVKDFMDIYGINSEQAFVKIKSFEKMGWIERKGRGSTLVFLEGKNFIDCVGELESF